MEAGGRTADPQTQLQLLVEEDMWPPTKALRFVDFQGKTISEYGNTQGKKLPIIQILDTQLRQGQLLTVVLESLEAEEVTALVGLSTSEGDIGSSVSEKADALRRRLIQRAKERMDKLFMSRLRSLPMPDSPAAQLLLKRFPQLPGPVVEQILESVTSAEYDALTRGVRVPVRIAEEAEIFSQELRLTRAYEGLYLEYLNNPDTHVLILHSLAEMPGWSQGVRIEVREGDFSGRLLDHVGEADAPIRKVLVKEGNRYQTFDAANMILHGLDDLYASVLHALPDEQRQALGFAHPSQGPALKQALTLREPISRNALRKALHLPPPQDHSPLELARGRALESFPDTQARRCGRSPFQCFRSTPRRIRQLIGELYPTHTPEAIEGFLQIDDLYSREGVQRLEALKVEFRALVKALEDWKARPPELTQISRHHVRLIHPMDKQRVINKLIKCWQRRVVRPRGNVEAPQGVTLDIDGIHFGPLPELSADFSHVVQLNFSNVYLQPDINTFLRHFPRLTSLTLTSTHLNEVPAALFDLTSLNHLDLAANNISLTPEVAARFEGMTQLTALNLSHNPLGTLPDFSHLMHLRRLNLRETGINRWPAGTDDLPGLTHLDLRENNLTSLPQSVFRLPRERLRRTYIHGNPLPDATFDVLMAYREQLGLRVEARLHAAGSAPHQANLWLEPGLSTEQRADKVTRWAALQAEPGSHDFFRVINDLVISPDFLHARQQLTQRVWRVISAAAEDTQLRDALFAAATEHEACIDRVSTVFSRFGYKVLLRDISLLRGAVKESQLSNLIRGRTRLLQLDDIAQTQIDLQKAAYAAPRQEGRLPPSEIEELKPDPLEVQLIYQVDLANRLELPWQPAHMTFRQLAKISPAQIEEAYNLVINQEKVPGYLPRKMLEEQPWTDFLYERYGAQINVERAPFEQRIADIDRLQDKQEQWADTLNEGDTESRKNLANELKVLAGKLGVEEPKVFTGAPMPDDEYYALQLKAREERDNVLVKLTQKILNKKPLSPILE